MAYKEIKKNVSTGSDACNQGYGERLVKERKRLGLSQKDFAGEVHVTGRTQRAYEKEEWPPDLSYLARCAQLGIDVQHVVSGIPSQRDAHSALAVLKVLAGKLGIDLDAIKSLIRRMAEEPIDQWDGQTADTELEKGIDAMLRLYGVAGGDYLVPQGRTDDNLRLLCRVIAEVEMGIHGSGKIVMGTTAKARMITMVYRACLPLGRVDSQLVADAIAMFSDE